MTRELRISMLTALALIAACAVLHLVHLRVRAEPAVLYVGFVYDSDESTPYTVNFIRAQQAVEVQFGERVKTLVRDNVPADEAEQTIEGLVADGCGIIFTNSSIYAATAKRCAMHFPDVEFCQATGDNAADEPYCKNYHTFMGEIYQGRYVAGIVAGMKLQELIAYGQLSLSEATIGYVAAYPVPEVVSGYTAFLLGVRSIVPDATMTVRYTNAWSSYTLEKQYAADLIEGGCVIISQHSDTIGPAIACEEAADRHVVFHVGYSQSMMDVAPTTSLISTRINWAPYMCAAIQAVREQKSIERELHGHVHGNDVGAGFDQDWVQMLELNESIAAYGTERKMAEAVRAFKKGEVSVFSGNYIGVNPDDPTDVYDLRQGFAENAESSAPRFYYVLKDVIRIL